jgi:hypothetical protein
MCVNFDLERMEKALKSRRLTMPAGLTREQFRKWMKINAGKLTGGE